MEHTALAYPMGTMIENTLPTAKNTEKSVKNTVMYERKFGFFGFLYIL